MKKGFGFLRNIVWLTQLGLSVAAPPVLGQAKEDDDDPGVGFNDHK